ncbi:unnamed protein product [Trichogramma brassicae]|uniref:Uncharacterized protein n=1 Tax=Trichogramma brassicae TaxID=86971 RepID=A0A6H5IXG5_9HYME|nr:unnamed protein product [Trichogramma brassicae]
MRSIFMLYVPREVYTTSTVPREACMSCAGHICTTFFANNNVVIDYERKLMIQENCMIAFCNEAYEAEKEETHNQPRKMAPMRRIISTEKTDKSGHTQRVAHGSKYDAIESHSALKLSTSKPKHSSWRNFQFGRHELSITSNLRKPELRHLLYSSRQRLHRYLKLTLPKFSGLQHEWDTFKALFTSMVKDAPTLTPTLKLQHLFACVEGDALRTIKSIEVTGDNFDVAWTALSRRYENKRKYDSRLCNLIKTQMRARCLNSTSTHVATGAAVASHTSTNERATILGTAQVRAVNSRGEELLVRALIDPASEGSFVTEHVAQMLALPKKSTPLSVSGVGGQVSAKTKASVSMTLYSTNSFNASISLTAAVLPKVSTLLPKRAIDDTRWPHLKGWHWQILTTTTPAPVDCLIGAELYPEIVKAGLRKKDQSAHPWLTTLFLAGSSQDPPTSSELILTLSAHSSSPSCPWNRSAASFASSGSLKRCKLSPTLTPAEKNNAKTIFTLLIDEMKTGRFVVRLPLTNTPELPGSYVVIAKQRFLSLERRLAKSPELGQQYNKFMQDYEDLHHMRKASPAQSNVKTAYIPHHAVVGKKLRGNKGNSTTNSWFSMHRKKPNNGKSLNDFLHVGGKLQSGHLNDHPSLATRSLRFYSRHCKKCTGRFAFMMKTYHGNAFFGARTPKTQFKSTSFSLSRTVQRVRPLSRLTSDASNWLSTSRLSTR